MNNPLPLVKSICIQFALILSFLIALGPFLHAHYGVSTVTGLHVPGVSAVTGPTGPEFAATSFSQDQEQESAALGVETSFSRQIGLDVQDQPQLLLILTITFLTGLVQSAVSSLFTSVAQRNSRPYFLPGFPLLTHAPPKLRY